MRWFAVTLLTLLPTVQVVSAQSNQDFSGAWNLNSARSEIQPSIPAEPTLTVDQSAASITIGPASTYPLDGRTEKRRAGDFDFSTTTKWEGAALLVNTIVSGPQNYTVMERWTRSRDGSTLTIRRTIVRLHNEIEATLVYNRAGSALSTSNSGAPDVPAVRALLPNTAAPPPPAPAEFVVDQGTRILLRLTNSVNTKRTAPETACILKPPHPSSSMAAC